MEENNFEGFLFKHLRLLRSGIKSHLILPYESALIERLNTIYFGGLPASVLLLSHSLCAGKCYDRATLLSIGLDEFEMVWGDLPIIALHCGWDNANHCWVESGGWVYDTTACLKIHKRLYYLMEKPIKVRKKDKRWCVEQDYYQDMLAQSSRQRAEALKHTLPLLIPSIESKLEKELLFGQTALSILESFKIDIGYESIKAEVEEDIKDKAAEIREIMKYFNFT